ncbi:MAG: 30S ribosomal protein S7 [Chrysiogenetes bacterium]|nr:30S ribosomal protein S7 [Chrysiogenetes bacterium]
MSRKSKAEKREILPDPKFHSPLVAKFINNVMLHGKKSTAETIVYDALDIVAEKSSADPLDVFRKAMEQVKPNVEVKSRRVGGANYQVPVEVSQDRRQALAMRWIIDNSRDRSGRSMREKLAAELLEASMGRGGAVRKREETHRMAEANKAFAHYRW